MILRKQTKLEDYVEIKYVKIWADLDGRDVEILIPLDQIKIYDMLNEHKLETLANIMDLKSLDIIELF
jgi:hypothetical protein